MHRTDCDEEAHDLDCSRRRLLAWLIAPFLSVVLAAGRGEDAAAQPGSRRQPPETRKVRVDGRATYTDVNAAGLAAMLEQKDFPLINVHIPYEGEIEGTDQLIPFDQVEGNLGKLPADKGARLVLYCRSGNMSAIAARALVKGGYTDVWNLEGGMIAWEQAGYPLGRRGR
jgi:phage shock protein E